MSCSVENRQTQFRRVMITINNPLEKGLSREILKNKIKELTATVYYAISEEIGAEGTPHCHIILFFKSPVRWSTLRKKFEGGHIDPLRGSAREARDYVAKQGKWAASEKKLTSLSFEEEGTLPEDCQGKRSDLDNLYQQIKDGLSDYAILENNPRFLRHINLIDKARQAIAKEEAKKKFRQLAI